MRSPVQSWVPLPSISLSIRQTDFFLQDEIIPPLSRWDFLIYTQQNLFVPSGLLERALALGTPEGLWPAASRPLYCSLAGDNISVLLSHDPPSGPLEPSGPPFGLLEQSLRLYLERAKRLWNGPPALWNARSANGPPQAIGTGFSLWNARSANGPPSCLNVRLPAEPLSLLMIPLRIAIIKNCFRS